MSTNWRSSKPEAIEAHPLMAAEITWHRKMSTLEREIKRLRSEVGLMAKRYHGARSEINDMVTRLRARPPPPVPERGLDEEETTSPTTTEEDQDDTMTGCGREEEKDEEEDERMGSGEEETPTPSPKATRAATPEPPPPPPPSPPPTKTTKIQEPSKVGQYRRTKDTFIDPLDKVDQERAFWKEIVKARSKRWSILAEDMIDWEETGPEMLRLHRSWWAGRWDTLKPENATTLREAEREMMAFFGRKVGEIDKRCWMVDHEYATMGQDQISGMRSGKTPAVKWTGKGRDRYGETKAEPSGWRQ
ncbi:hypothetical protein Q9L58_010377 [Maublancomyces gigas]|uniref:Uncharacterized protein n=1 Tax=Discina gigas TaxID=1032678 RepID=A0ABR3G493_9PEZI